ncbi:MAG TPA: helix-turn-helix transcriptional regulator [Pyrinomonadaceae bacterium]|nr:helix-turn-helix transcriptional regulator [Pyrinomonadaceae bacterium]
MAASIGEQLRLAREARGIGLREICDQTRISVHYLEAIEANDYKRLPGGVFNRSFIKAYAKCVGYDEREAIEGYTRYLREHGDQAADEVNTTPMHSKVYTDTPATRSPVLTVILAILILAILTAAALAALYWFQRRAQIEPPHDEPFLALSQTHTPMYNGLTSATTDLGTHDHIRHF